MPSIDPRKIREEAAKRTKQTATAVTGDIVGSINTIEPEPKKDDNDDGSPEGVPV